MEHIEGIKRMVDRQLALKEKEAAQKKKEVESLFEERARVHLKIHGKVQGVFFRAFVESKAIELKLAGRVQNKEDGVVEVVAEGEKSALEKLIEHCKKGPRSSVITDVEVKWETFRGEFGNFVVNS